MQLARNADVGQPIRGKQLQRVTKKKGKNPDSDTRAGGVRTGNLPESVMRRKRRGGTKTSCHIGNKLMRYIL